MGGSNDTMEPTNNDKRNIIRKYLLNKYVLTLLIFAVVFIFVGDRSLIHRIQLERKIRTTQETIQQKRADIIQSQKTLQTLQDTDSLEQYAREHYGMHTSNEDVYLIDP